MKNFLLTLILSLTLAGCGSGEEGPGNEPPVENPQCLSSLTGNYTGEAEYLSTLGFSNESYTLEVNSGNNADGMPETVLLITFAETEKICALISEPRLVADATEEADVADAEEAEADVADAEEVDSTPLSGTFTHYDTIRHRPRARRINTVNVLNDCSSLTLNSQTTPEKDTEGAVRSFEDIKAECTSL